VGIKKAKWNLGRGFYIILVTDEDGLVKEFQLLSGFFVTARFESANKYIGLSVSEARAAIKQKNMLAAFDEAVGRINVERKHHELTPFNV
jgi:DNA-binding transcriptional regulator of glucitol operon